MFDINSIKKNIIPILSMILILTILIVLDLKVFNINEVDVEEEIKEDLKNKKIKINSLVINEIMTSNKGAHNDPTGESYDWIEIYNGTKKDINLKNYGLTDNKDGTVSWTFPDVIIKKNSYLLVYICGEEKEGLYANFSLKKSGDETITLRKPNGKVVDTVKTIALKKNTSYARNYNGKWIVTDEFTPGYSNNKDGRKEYLTSINDNKNDLIISEFLPKNKGNFVIDNKLYGYIEVKNVSNKTIDLSEYYVSNCIDRPFYYKLPKEYLKKGETYVIFTNDLNKGNNANFELTGKKGEVVLSHINKIIETVKYEDLTNGLAYVKINDKFEVSNNISPGYDNDVDGKIESFKKYDKNSKELIITEVMSSNYKLLGQNGGKFYDWIELYNNTDKDINLNDYALSNDDNSKTMFKLPNKTLKSHEYIVVMASGNTGYTTSKFIHTNFKISTVESIYLFKNNKLIDSIFAYNIPKGYSYGRGSTYGHYYYNSPTPNSANNTSGNPEIANAPVFSTTGGVFNNVSNVKVELQGNGTIYYTLDGSMPNKNSKVYSSPIVLKKTTVIRAISYESGKKNSEVITNSYIINENHSIPVMSVSLPESSFNSVNRVFSINEKATTKQAHAELFEKESSFTIDCGLKVFGGESRFMPKKSYALKFTKAYTTEELKYKVFDDRDAIEYETLVLRSGSQDMKGTMFRDEFVASIYNDYTNIDVQASKPVILYINGKYWGLYFLREKIDNEFIQHHYNVANKSNIVRIDYDVTEGSSTNYRNLVNYATSHDLSKDLYYSYVASKLDIDNYIDYWIGQIYTNNYDTRNVRYFNNAGVDNNKIKMIGYDFDFAFNAYPENYYEWMMDPKGMGYYKIDNKLIVNLMKNSKFRRRWLERVGYNLNNVWTDEHINKNFSYYYNIVKPEISRDHKRWSISYDSWYKEVNNVKSYLKNRRTRFINITKSYFNISDREMNSYLAN